MIQWYVTLRRLLRDIEKKSRHALELYKEGGKEKSGAVNGYLKSDYQKLTELWRQQFPSGPPSNLGRHIAFGMDADYSDIVSHDLAEIEAAAEERLLAMAKTQGALGFEHLLHPAISKASYQLYRDGHLREAVFNSVVAVFDRVRELTKIQADGDAGVSDVSGIYVTLHPGVDIKGAVQMPAPSPEMSGHRAFGSVNAEPITPDRLPFGAYAAAAPVEADGAFTLKNVFPGRYSITATTSTGYVSSISSGTADVLGAGITVGEAPPEALRITVNPGGGTVAGRVTGLAPGQSATVAVVRTYDSYLLPTIIHTYNHEGKFEASNLAPGEYTAYAWLSTREVEYRNGSALAEVGKAASITVNDNSTQTLELKLATEQR